MKRRAHFLFLFLFFFLFPSVFFSRDRGCLSSLSCSWRNRVPSLRREDTALRGINGAIILRHYLLFPFSSLPPLRHHLQRYVKQEIEHVGRLKEPRRMQRFSLFFSSSFPPSLFVPTSLSQAPVTSPPIQAADRGDRQ